MDYTKDFPAPARAALMENRSGLVVEAMVTQADGTAERDAGLLMLYKRWRKRRWQSRSGALSVGADKAYDTRDFIRTVREMTSGRT